MTEQEKNHLNHSNLPIGKNEDVEFSEELADEADREAMKRAEAADARAEQA
ncbi:hypothetical protein FHS18_001019 [Paenibacillus phyllosphaerae]|uniref:YfhD-like protein n=1 Tax=Paenibacillus phyllosphaerae TaxID=274593 RepID=A0A7W5AUL2_9BACL|nr:YfhD family protein [Paenibacillus phyllosphaerae]MBB3108967.1 hypothetical protein [Paenibacillus phyllosphaerae]